MKNGQMWIVPRSSVRCWILQTSAQRAGMSLAWNSALWSLVMFPNNAVSKSKAVA